MGLELEAVGVSVIRNDSLFRQGLLRGPEAFRRTGRLILDNVSFVARPGELTAIIGPNGAGKTTLMRALSGERPDAGRVLIGGEDLYADPEYWLKQIGYVPVDNILHTQLGLEQALEYVVRLRLPDCTPVEIAAKVDAVLNEFEFRAKSDRRKRIGVLSTGERKRANICAELLSDPPVLMLDEPTSNLDPDAERNLMELLAKRARDHGQTIIVITHTLSSIDYCKQVVYIANSRLLDAGPTGEVLARLEAQLIEPRPALTQFDRWANTFDAHKTHDRTAQIRGELLDRQRAAAQQAEQQRLLAGPSPRAPRPPAVETPWRDQLRTLLDRYHHVRLGDRGSLLGTLFAGLSGVLFLILPADTFIRPGDSAELGLAITQARQSVYVIALVVALLGLIVTHTEIAREFRIYRHERLKGLSPSAYFLAKWLWLVPAVGVLAPTLLLFFIVIVYRQPLTGFPTPTITDPAGAWERIVRYQLPGLFTTGTPWIIWLTLVLACISSLTLGLLLSALTADSERGFVFLSFAAIFNVVFAGLLRNPKLQTLVDSLSYFSTGKWAFEGFASSIDIYCWLQGWRLEEFNSTGHLLSVWLALAAFTLAVALLTILALRWRDPWYGRLQNLRRLFLPDGAQVAAGLALLTVLLSFTVFLRAQSRSYHELTFYSDPEHGGSGSVVYGSLRYVPGAGGLQRLNGLLGQSWCSIDSGEPAGEVLEPEGELIE